MSEENKVGDIFSPNKHNISIVIKKLTKLEKKVNEIFKSIHGIEPNEADTYNKRIEKLEKDHEAVIRAKIEYDDEHIFFSVHDKEIVELKKEISELKIQLDEHWNRLEHQATLYDTTSNIKSVLEGFFEAFDNRYGSHFRKQLDGEKELSKRETAFYEASQDSNVETSVPSSKPSEPSEFTSEDIDKAINSAEIHLISEFLEDWKWGKAFEKHRRHQYLRKKCKCEFSLTYWRWFEEKWQKRAEK